ncbi:MAG: hypothetical protein HFH02_06145 [Dorea sp.]|nr:hypothetical protein [Dorea sp.]
MQMYRARARSEEERSEAELGMARKESRKICNRNLSCGRIGREPAARRSEAKPSWGWREKGG